MENKVTRITTLEEHRKLLRMVFETAKSRVLIVSPFVSDSAINADNIPGLIRAAVKKGVSVTVYTDDRLNTTADGTAKMAAIKGVHEIASAGAVIYVASGIHHKTLIKDEDLITEGSFNWLSAVREKGGVHQREERTLVISDGAYTAEMIKSEIAKLSTLVSKKAPIRYTVKNAWETTKSEKAYIVLALGAIVAFILYIASAKETPNKTEEEIFMENMANQTDVILNDHTGLYICLLVFAIIVFVVIKARKSKPVRANETNNDMITYIASYYLDE